MMEKKAFTGGLSTDRDSAYIQPNQYLNALNIRVASTEDGTAGALSNVKGNTKVAFTMPSGTNTCIGSFEDTENSRVFYFVHNSNDDHLIMCYFHKEDTIRKVLDNTDFPSGDNGLEFSTSNLITGVGMNDDLLFFTDGATEPKRINVERGLKKYNASYTQLKSYTNLSKYVDITDGLVSVMRPSPIYPLTTDLIEDTSRNNNLIRGNSFTFAYRFVYVDGEISGLSPYSKVIHHLNPDDSTEYDYNTIELTIPTNQSVGEDVSEIEFLVKYNDETNFSVFFTEKEYNNVQSHNSEDYVANFANDSVKIDISAGEVTRYFSAVPVKAQALECAKGRVFMGNTTEGYDNKEVEQLRKAFKITPEVKLGSGVSATGNYKMYRLYYKDYLGANQVRYYRFVRTEGTTADGFYEFSGHGNPHLGTDSEVTDWESGTLNATRYPASQSMSGLSVVSNDSDILPYVVAQAPSNATNAAALEYNTSADTSVTITGVTSNTITLSEGLRLWKTASSYAFALAFADKYGRLGTIIEINNAKNPVTIPRRDATFTKAVNRILWDMDADNLKAVTNKHASIIPDWAHTFQFLRTKSLNKSFFINFVTKGTHIVYADDLGTSASTNGTYQEDRDKYVRVNLEDSRTNGIGYNYSEGDILYIAGLNNADRELVVVAQQDGYIYAEAKDVGTIKTGTTFDIECEIYSPTLTQPTQAYYEFGEVYKITNAGASNRTFSQVSGSFDDGDVVIKERNFNGTTVYLEQTNPDTGYYKDWIQLTGRVFAPSRFGQVHKPNSISFSENRIEGTLFNGLSTFNALDEKTLPQEMGTIKKLLFTSKTESTGNTMLAIGAMETASVYIGESQISTGGGSSLIAVQSGVIGSAQVLRGSYGTMHPESVVTNNNRVYFYDALNGTVVRYDVNGLRPIGDAGIKSFFRERSNHIVTEDKVGCFGGYDRIENEYILTLPSIDNAEQEYLEDYISELSNNDVLDGNTSEYDNLTLDLTGDVKKGRKYRVEIGDQTGLDFSDDNSLFESITIKYSDNTSIGVTNGTDKGAFIEFVATQNSTGLKLTIEDTEGVSRDDSDDMYIIVSEFIPSYYELENGDAVTLAYNESIQAWSTQYSFVPENIQSVGTEMITFKSGELWLHNSNNTRNNFYGTQYKSRIMSLTRNAPSLVKSFDSVSFETNQPPTFMHFRTESKYMDKTSAGEPKATATYSDFIQSSDLTDEDLRQYEGHYVGPIMRNRLEPPLSSYNEQTYFNQGATGERLISNFLLFMLEFTQTDKVKLRFANILFSPQTGNKV